MLKLASSLGLASCAVTYLSQVHIRCDYAEPENMFFLETKFPQMAHLQHQGSY